MASYSSYSAEQVVRVCVANGERCAWQEFLRRFQPVISATVLRTARQCGHSEKALLDDLIQDVLMKLCDDNYRLLRNFQAQHPDSIYGFLKKVAMNTVRDHFKATRTEKRGAARNHVAIDGAGTHAIEIAAESDDPDRTVLLHEIEAHLQRVAPGEAHRRERLIFNLYYRQGLTAPAIAVLPGIGLTTKGVESTLLRLTRSIRQAIAETTSVPRGSYSGKGWSAGKSS